jgi:hypothetical protein
VVVFWPDRRGHVLRDYWRCAEPDGDVEGSELRLRRGIGVIEDDPDPANRWRWSRDVCRRVGRQVRDLVRGRDWLVDRLDGIAKCGAQSTGLQGSEEDFARVRLAQRNTTLAERHPNRDTSSAFVLAVHDPAATVSLSP